MSCVWNSLIRSLKNNDLSEFCGTPSPTPIYFLKFLKKNNKITKNISHQGMLLKNKNFLLENFKRIENINNVSQGYLTSGCEPIFILISYLFRIKIIHNFDGNRINYIPTDGIRYTIQLNSNKSHMWS